MSKVIPMELEDGTFIYIESSEDVNAPLPNLPEEPREQGLVSKGSCTDAAFEKFKSLERTIRAYTIHTLKAFKEIADDNIDKVTLEFGITVGGEAGIPYITKGTAESSLKVTVQCSFPNKETSKG